MGKTARAAMGVLYNRVLKPTTNRHLKNGARSSNAGGLCKLLGIKAEEKFRVGKMSGKRGGAKKSNPSARGKQFRC